MPELQLKELPEMRLAAVEHRGAFHQISEAYERLGGALAASDAWGSVGGMVAVYYDSPMDTPEPDLRSHAGAIWTGGDLPEGTEEVMVPAGKYAVYTLVGPYSGLAAAWMSMTPEAIAATGTRMRQAPSLEMYLNSPEDTPEDQLRTDLCLAVE